MKDSFVTCRRCGSNICYEQETPQKDLTWLCLSCGFNTSTQMKVGSKTVEEIYTRSPNLYRELFYQDDQKYVWAPSVITNPEVGMVFIDGGTLLDWKWKFVPAVAITDAERSKFPKEQTHRMDLKNSKVYDQNQFGEAMSQVMEVL
jgi:ribosomal protein L37E